MSNSLNSNYTVPTFNSCTKFAGSPGMIHDRTPWCGCMDELTTERRFDSKLRGSLIYLAYFFFDMLAIGVSTTNRCQTSGRLVLELNVCTVVYPSYLLLRYQAVWHMCGPYTCDGIDHFGQNPIQHSSRDLNSKLDKILHFAELRR